MIKYLIIYLIVNGGEEKKVELAWIWKIDC